MAGMALSSIFTRISDVPVIPLNVADAVMLLKKIN
jgi:hypothetical protein